MTERPNRVEATDAARQLIADIRQDHPEIIFHQSGGCCDGSSPMCYPAADFRVGVVPGRGGMFSLDNGREKRFLARARVFTDEELAVLGSA